MSITGEPGRGPLRAGIPVADLCSGLFCAIGILIALLDREMTGEGQWVQTSLLQAQVAMLDFQAASWLIDRVVPGQTGNHHPYMTPMGVFPSADGNIVIGASGQKQYRKFCQALGADELISDPRFMTMEDRAKNREEFKVAVAAYTRRRSNLEWVERFNEIGIACGPVNSIDKVFADPQVRQLGMVKAVRHRRLGELQLLGSPIKLSASEPEKGEHSGEILQAFDFTAVEIAELRTAGIVQ
jgi:formyl-CoA transferase